MIKGLPLRFKIANFKPLEDLKYIFNFMPN